MNKAAVSLVIREIPTEGYERVIEFKEEESGLHAIIAVHDSRLGPALGGIRAYPYATFEEGFKDVLRLAQGMTYKAAVSETGTGGAKAVIFTDNKKKKSPELLLAFAEAVNYFEGKYICAEDVGMSVQDVAQVGEGTPYAVGLPWRKSSGDPSRYTAFGGFCGIQAVCKKITGSDDVAGKTFAVQGLGAVGMRLAEYLFWGGARLVVSDINKEAVERAVKDFGAEAVAPDQILSVSCDVLVPCALGAILNPTTIPRLRCQAVAGLANNQLLSDQDGEALFQRGILYAPDFVINAGGLLAVCVELEPEGFDPSTARHHVERIYDLITTIFETSDKKKRPTSLIAKELAEQNLMQGNGKRTLAPVFRTA
ncbi:Leu/Phe/Val dehydrogenase [Chlamydiota bacterium]